MTEYRLAKPEEWEDCIELANYVFSTAHRPHDFEQLIPRVYQAGPEMARIHRVAVAENGRLRAEIAVLPQQMAAGGKLLRAGYVGSVSVHPKARGEGHMKRLLGDWITDLEGTCDLLALDGQRQRYAYFGFTPGSEKYTFYLDVANVRHTWKNGERIGYLALCGGNQVVEAEVLEEQDFVPALAAYLKENALDSLFISIPVYETGKAAALSEVCEGFTKERCGSAMYRIFEFADVIEAMLTMKAETMGISDGTWSAVLEGQPLTVTVKDGTVTVTREAHPGADVLNREQAQELLLSPLASKGSKVPSEIWKNIPSDWFPLPLYCATADEF